MPEQRDVIIVGAGPAGSALAYFLAARGLDVLLLDKSAFPRDKTCGDGLSPRAMHVLRAMGLLDPLLAVGWKINNILLFAPNGRPISAPVPPYDGLPNFALVLPRLQLDDLIRAQAVKAGAEFRSQFNVTDLMREGNQFVGLRATTPDGPRELRAPLSVLATGASVGLLERADLLAAPPAFGRAARTYYEGMRGLSDTIEFHFDSVPLPGYGWVFPISPTAANVGAGYFVRAGKPPMRNSPRQVMDDFIASPYVANMLDGAHPTAPPKGYPLRFDFPTARTAFPGLALVGEACGLVNPLTGEGIDYALESAEVAAEVLGDALRCGEASALTAQRYDQALRDRFLRTFVNIRRVRDLYIQGWVLNRFAAAANHNKDLKLLLIHIALGNIDPIRALSPKTLLQVALG
jgi:geranylgeranyl reductase family protein